MSSKICLLFSAWQDLYTCSVDSCNVTRYRWNQRPVHDKRDMRDVGLEGVPKYEALHLEWHYRICVWRDVQIGTCRPFRSSGKFCKVSFVEMKKTIILLKKKKTEKNELVLHLLRARTRIKKYAPPDSIDKWAVIVHGNCFKWPSF